MSTGGWIVIAAVLTAGVYAFRWFRTKTTAAAAITSPGGLAKAWGATFLDEGPLISPEGFLVAWGVTWIGVSLAGAAYPPLGSALALLILVGDILTNGVAVSKEASSLEESKTKTKKGK